MYYAGCNIERDFLKHLHLQQISKKQLSGLASSSSHSDANLLNASTINTMIRSHIRYAGLDPRIREDSGEVQR